MRRNCNLELRLVPNSDPDHLHLHLHHQPILEEKESSSDDQRQQLTIFYNGNVCVCNVTELQARAILLLARGEMEEKMRSPMGTPTGSEIASPTLPSQVCSPTAAGLSMKRSIQRFLQKRKHRVQTTSPYNH